MQDKIPQLQSLIDIPWGETDCLHLTLMAQAILFDHEITVKECMAWEDKTLKRRSQKIKDVITNYCEEIASPEAGAVCLMQSLGYMHLCTFIDPEHILTIRKGGRSEINYYNEAYRHMTKKIYKVKRADS